jgi:dynein heavy chain 2
LDNVAHLDRILCTPSSSVVLAGRAGIGRRTALYIVSVLHGATLFTLKVGQNYGIKQFKTDLKSVGLLSLLNRNTNR